MIADTVINEGSEIPYHTFEILSHNSPFRFKQGRSGGPGLQLRAHQITGLIFHRPLDDPG